MGARAPGQGCDYSCRSRSAPAGRCSLDSNGVAFVLVRPQRGANVGAACRALKNMGFGDLRLVESGVDRADPATRNPAYGAWDVLDAAREFHSLLDAIGDCAAVAACSGRVGEEWWTPRRLASGVASVTSGGRLAVVFGPEASGLTNAELRLCPLHVRIPSAPEQPSLNLAQAVLVLAYELRLASETSEGAAARRPAPLASVEQALADLREAMLAIGFLQPASPDVILGELRSLLTRARPDEREVVLLRGLARQMRWAGGRIAEQGPPQG
jgi:TrmH family RNA methyltransferase